MFILGYVLEPTMRDALTLESPEPEPEVSAPASDVAAVEPEPAIEDPETTPTEPEIAVVEPETPATTPGQEVSGTEPDPEDEIEVVVAPEEPAPTEPTGPVVTPVADSEDIQIRQLMHQSLQNGEISHFDVSQVTRVTDVGQEVINGVQYQFGILEYRDNTVFGQRDFEAKALIRDGKLEKWVWPANGMRIP